MTAQARQQPGPVLAAEQTLAKGVTGMDRTDYQILNILQADCRATLKCIGDQVGLTAPAVSSGCAAWKRRA